MITRAKWITNPSAKRAAPFFRKEIQLDKMPADPMIRICGVGYYELWINGRKVGDHVLDPAPSQYDKHYYYVDYDVKDYLRKGRNCIGIILGNGWFDPGTADGWGIQYAVWKNSCRVTMDLRSGGETLCVTDSSWKTATGPITFNELRNGEFYDARLEFKNWAFTGFDDSEWKNAALTHSPGGLPAPEIMPPCKVMEVLLPEDVKELEDGKKIWDFGFGLTGWVRIRVRGEAGAAVTLKHSDMLLENGDIDTKMLASHTKSGEFQTDKYILKGEGDEIWEPRFTYHGFRYTQSSVEGNAEIISMEACFVHTAFEQIGKFECSSETLNKLQTCTQRSFRGNFTAIPTDCPHREKNGWTGDAHLAAEAGFCNYDMASSYAQWLQTFGDAQRPSGQLVGTVPSTAFSYCAGWNGPAWESAFLLISWYHYLYTGDKSILAEHYDGFKRYMDYLDSMSEDGIVYFGLGDWCPPGGDQTTPSEITSTGYYYADLVITAKTASILGFEEESKEYYARAAYVRDAFRKKFGKGNGVYGIGDAASISCAVYQGLTDETETKECAAQLAELFRKNGAKAEFGILGAKYAPRVLAENGYIDLVYDIFTQEEYPGWGNWIKRGATTLWETWEGDLSLNHIMYGDISACMFHYFAGLRPVEEAPGFRKFLLKPMFPKKLDYVRMSYKSPKGEIKVDWYRNGDCIEFQAAVPEGTEAILNLPEMENILVPGGTYCFTLKG